MAVREGKWDCEYCGAANPGSEMKCTSCGATRGENVKFYLEEDAAEVSDMNKLAQAQGGADWHCAYCGTDNRAGTEKCRQCGAAKDGMDSREEKFIPAEGEAPETPERKASADGRGTAPAKSKKPLLFGIVGAVLVAVVLIFIFARGKEAGLLVDSGEWTRTIGVEEQQWITYEEWEDQVPSDAQILDTWEEKRTTEQVKVGTEKVKVGTKDKGNGYFEDVFEERDIYEERDVYDYMVKYEVQEWIEIRKAESSGGINDPPVWPGTNLGSGERNGTKTEEAALHFTSTDPEDEGKIFTYTKLKPDELSQFKAGQSVNARVSGNRVNKLLEDE